MRIFHSICRLCGFKGGSRTRGAERAGRRAFRSRRGQWGARDLAAVALRCWWGSEPALLRRAGSRRALTRQATHPDELFVGWALPWARSAPERRDRYLLREQRTARSSSRREVVPLTPRCLKRRAPPVWRGAERPGCRHLAWVRGQQRKANNKSACYAPLLASSASMLRNTSFLPCLPLGRRSPRREWERVRWGQAADATPVSEQGLISAKDRPRGRRAELASYLLLQPSQLPSSSCSCLRQWAACWQSYTLRLG